MKIPGVTLHRFPEAAVDEPRVPDDVFVYQSRIHRVLNVRLKALQDDGILTDDECETQDAHGPVMSTRSKIITTTGQRWLGKKARPAQLNLGPHRFKLASGTHKESVVVVVDGTLKVEVLPTAGLISVALKRIQTKRRSRNDGTYHVATRWQIPDRPGVSQRLVYAETRILNQSTPEET